MKTKTVEELKATRTPKIFTSLQILEAQEVAMRELDAKHGGNFIDRAVGGFALAAMMIALGVHDPEGFFEPDGV